jgi:predicted helicase
LQATQHAGPALRRSSTSGGATYPVTMHAEDAIKDQSIPVRRIGMHELADSPIDWSKFSAQTPEVLELVGKKQPRPHQISAIEAVAKGFERSSRGKLIMACGTGKTFTTLRIAEQIVGSNGAVLFLVPSISLLSQSLREWTNEATVAIAPLAVCSDAKASKCAISSDDEDISAVDLALPATTDPGKVRQRLAAAGKNKSCMTVVFSTYQSIQVIADAMAGGGIDPFDLVICDEAHRTTGVTLAGQDESAFVRVHEETFIPATRRLYMTATPRIYNDTSKQKAAEGDAILASMDDEDLYGPEFYRRGFGEAVSKDLLTDYKVLVLAVEETAVAKTFQQQLSDEHNELRLDDAAKIVGCWNGLAKRGETEHSFGTDPHPMRRAVAFSRSIKDSQAIQRLFTSVVNQYIDAHDLDDEDREGPDVLRTEIEHVDGTFNALLRNQLINWLKEEADDHTCRILTNARCLSEGVDVPALDAVLFLNPRNSVVDVVQSVGRVMRKAAGKRYGYIILPVGIPAGMTPEDALADNRRYKIIWDVLQALRAHDERFDAMVNKLDLNTGRDRKINVIGVGGGGSQDSAGRIGKGEQGQMELMFPDLEEWREAIYAKLVANVGTRRYWETWAGDIANIAARHITRITALLDDDRTTVQASFDEFLVR